ncbi:MAG TPA: pilus assembly protein N-terminal domain-containing protein, partial [Roseiarcus sp.]|nr:pilus assembly protein N-terminal domain-containing protein [Roseiarcus sp.]
MTGRFFLRTAFALGLAAALGAETRAVHAAEPDRPCPTQTAGGGPSKTMQLGVGKSVICDLPEEAAEIYVGDPRVANAIVRSARRIYVSALANGQTTIFALAADGRRIETIDVSVGRDVGDLRRLLDVAMPGNS